MHQLVGQVPVIGKDEESCCVVVQAAYREYPDAVRHQICYDRAALLVSCRCHISRRLVQKIVDLLLLRLYPGSVHLDHIAVLHVVSRVEEHRAVDPDSAFFYHLIGLAPACDAGRCYILINSHCFLPVLQNRSSSARIRPLPQVSFSVLHIQVPPAGL